MIDIFTLHPALAGVQPSVEQLSRSGLIPHTFPAQSVLFEEGNVCAGFPLILSGEVCVSRRSHEGRSIELYRLQTGGICLVSCAGIFRKELLTAYAVTTRETRLVMIPPPVFHQWLDTPTFRDEILGLFATRLTDLTSLIDAIVFHKLDARLAASLARKGLIHIGTTHQALADELGTVREIVTRLLSRFEQKGWVKLSRESIQILDASALLKI